MRALILSCVLFFAGFAEAAENSSSLDLKLKSLFDRRDRLTKESINDNQLWFEAWKKRDQEEPAPQLGMAEVRGDGGVWILACIKKHSDGTRDLGWFQLVTATEWQCIVDEIAKLNRRVDSMERNTDDNTRRIAELERRIREYEEVMYENSRGGCRATAQPVYVRQEREVEYVPSVRSRGCYAPPPPRFCPPPPPCYEEPCAPRGRTSFGTGLGFERKRTFFGLGLFFRR